MLCVGCRNIGGEIYELEIVKFIQIAPNFRCGPIYSRTWIMQEFLFMLDIESNAM